MNVYERKKIKRELGQDQPESFVTGNYRKKMEEIGRVRKRDEEIE